MKSKATQTTVVPTVEYLTDILDQVTSGILSVPKFHRSFIWKADDMLALLESIYLGYPVGSFIFWKTDKIYDSDVHIKKNMTKKILDSSQIYILDGYQRLFTLYNTLILNPENKNNTYNIFFDLKMKKIIHAEKKQDTPIHYFPIKSLLKTTNFIKAKRNILAHSEHNGEELVEQAEILLQIFRQYRVSVIQIEGGDINDATQIFLRINSRGVRLTKDINTVIV